MIDMKITIKLARIFTGLILFTTVLMVRGQDINCEYLTVEDGLSNNSILDICQDSSGFIWVGTENGLNRYDGFAFRRYQYNPADTATIDNNAVSSICMTTGDDFFAGTFMGINYYHADLDIFERIPVIINNTRSSAKVYRIVKSGINSYLASTLEGLFYYDNESNVFRRYLPKGLPESIAKTHITSLLIDAEGIIWIGTHDDGVHFYDPAKSKTIELTHYIGEVNTLRGNKIIHINIDSRNRVWLSTNRGAYIFSKNDFTIQRFIRSKELSDSGIADISALYTFEESRNSMWVLTRNGLSIYHTDDQTFTHYFYDPYDNHSLSSNVLNVMYKDRQENIWIGTQQSGLNIIKKHSYAFNEIISHNMGQGIAPNDFILSMIEDRDGKIWLGTYGSGINTADFNNGIYSNINSANTPGLQSDHIQTLLEDSRGRIWIGTYLGGITVMDPKSGRNRNYMHKETDTTSLVNDIVNHIFEDSGKRIWIASHGGLSLFNPKSGSFINYSKGPDELWDMSFANQITEDGDGNLWISTFSGLFRFTIEPREVKYFKNTDDPLSLSDNFVFCVYCDTENRVWAGTLNGLNLYDPESGGFTRYSVDDGLPDNSIYTIINDLDKNLWLATTHGLSKFDPESGTFINFDRNDGLIQDVFYYNSVLRKESGELFFGSRHGVVYFDPRDIDYVVGDYEQELYLTTLRVFNEYVRPGPESIIKKPLNQVDKINLNYNESYISIEFTTFNYINSNADNFSYYLEGYDYDWIDLKGERSVTFTKIPPGKYTLHIKAVNNLIDNSVIETVDLNIKPPIWRSGVSYIVYVIILALITFFVYTFFRSRSVYKQNLLIEKLENEKNSEIYQSKIRFFINAAHEFKTPLTLILSPMEQLLNSGDKLPAPDRSRLTRLVYKNVQILSRLINQIIDLRKIDSGQVVLKAQKVDIVAFLRDISAYFYDYAQNHSIHFNFHTDIDSLEVWIDVEKSEKIFFNLISNAFKFTPDGKTIDLFIRDQPDGSFGIPEDKRPLDHVAISIVDNGVGINEENVGRIFDRFYQTDNANIGSATSSGIGLSIVKEYVDLHGGHILVQSEEGKGSEFIVLLPRGDGHLDKDSMTEAESYSLSNDYRFFTAPYEIAAVAEIFPKIGNTKILVVEDNYELRNYIVENLYLDFDVYEASDGEEGLRMAKEILPELIVSDVMMPKIDGYELCRAAKSDLSISHIPIILLTVLDSNSNKIEGYEGGADDYLNKPFDIQVLSARIRNLIESRNSLKQKYLMQSNNEMEYIVHSKTDEKFVKKAYDILERNLANIEFTAEEFSREMGMSRSNLHLKIKALTDQSTTEFIRNYRLKEAGKLLSTNDYNISEVAYMVGFNNISYFNRCFKKIYNQTPSEFLDKRQ
jgi:signal transduction histidine kinase/ligand-binding sensor domain-containing protein/DNA-binding response OmpR family regulator